MLHLFCPLMQYFLWYLCLLPVAAPAIRISLREAVLMTFLWFIGQVTNLMLVPCLHNCILLFLLSSNISMPSNLLYFCSLSLSLSHSHSLTHTHTHTHTICLFSLLRHSFSTFQKGLWLLPAYLLEFHGINTFLLIWLASLVFFIINIGIMITLVKRHVYTQTLDIDQMCKSD